MRDKGVRLIMEDPQFPELSRHVRAWNYPLDLEDGLMAIRYESALKILSHRSDVDQEDFEDLLTDMMNGDRRSGRLVR